MAEVNPSLTPPVSTKQTELWYAAAEDTGLKQVFGVQGIPQIISAPEDVTYRTLESGTEFAVPGVRPYETIEVETIYYPEQHTELIALEKTGVAPWWYVKLPDSSAATGEKPQVIKWRGALSVSIAELELDGTVKAMLTIGKSSVPETIDGLPAA